MRSLPLLSFFANYLSVIQDNTVGAARDFVLWDYIMLRFWLHTFSRHCHRWPHGFLSSRLVSASGVL